MDRDCYAGSMRDEVCYIELFMDTICGFWFSLLLQQLAYLKGKSRQKWPI